MDEAILHAHHLPGLVAATRLLQLLEQRNAFLLAHQYRDSDQSLLACVLNTLASCAVSCSIDFQLQVRDSILHWVPKAGRLSSVVGTFFGDLGPEAVDALAAVLPTEIDSTPPLMDAGYELHRSPERWKRIMELADQWPPALREALQRGGANHAARFP